MPCLENVCLRYSSPRSFGTNHLMCVGPPCFPPLEWNRPRHSSFAERRPQNGRSVSEDRRTSITMDRRDRGRISARTERLQYKNMPLERQGDYPLLMGAHPSFLGRIDLFHLGKPLSDASNGRHLMFKGNPVDGFWECPQGG